MRILDLLVAVAITLPIGLGACSKSRSRHDAAATPTERFSGRGRVVSISPSDLGIHHEAMAAVRTFDGKLAPMESMSMEFALPPSGPGTIAVGDVIAFEFTTNFDTGPTLRLTKIERLPSDTPLTLE